MSRKTVRLFTVSVLLIAGGLRAWAETATPSENVTVTAGKLREAFHNFTKTFVTPTALNGKIARWERGVCPVVVGQNPHFTAFIMQRIKYVALAAGAPVDTEASCTPNIEIVFTTTPQALLDTVRKDESPYLGYATSGAQLDAMAKVTRPIQAWYMTETVTMTGSSFLDSGRTVDDGTSMKNFNAMQFEQSDGSATASESTYYHANVARSNGNRIDDGIRSAFNHVLIVVDSSKLAGQKIVPLADYISMLALTQLNSLDACQQLPSIVNNLAANCGRAADGLTAFDLAYLQGLYKMQSGRKLVYQRNDIGDAMMDALVEPK